jgi:hypothetical protein
VKVVCGTGSLSRPETSRRFHLDDGGNPSRADRHI